MSIRPLTIPFGIALSALDKTVSLRYLLRIDLAEDIMPHYFARGLEEDEAKAVTHIAVLPAPPVLLPDILLDRLHSI